MASKFELYYGDPGSGKSRSIYELIKYVNATTGKKTRVYIGDGSGIMYDPLVDAGIVSRMDFRVRDNPFPTCQQICEGFWPQDVDDPHSKLRKLTPQEIGETNLWIFEGAAVMGNYMMGDAKGGLAQRAADGENIGGEMAVMIKDIDGHNYGGNNGAHYNLGQRHLHANIIRTKALPGMVIWTTHERMDDGERGGAFAKGADPTKHKLGEKMIGPELIGKALTANISRDFGNTLHFTVAGKKVQDGNDPATGKTNYKEKSEYRIYTRDHYDPDGIVPYKYRAVCRAINPAKINDYYTSEADKAGQALLEFYQALSEANKL